MIHQIEDFGKKKMSFNIKNASHLDFNKKKRSFQKSIRLILLNIF